MIKLKNKRKLTSLSLLKNHLLKINFYSTLIQKQSQKTKSLQVESQLKDTIQPYFLTKNNKSKKNQNMIKEKIKSQFRRRNYQIANSFVPKLSSLDHNAQLSKINVKQ